MKDQKPSEFQLKGEEQLPFYSRENVIEAKRAGSQHPGRRAAAWSLPLAHGSEVLRIEKQLRLTSYPAEPSPMQRHSRLRGDTMNRDHKAVVTSSRAMEVLTEKHCEVDKRKRKEEPLL